MNERQRPDYRIVDDGGIEGLTPDILLELRDIAYKLGEEDSKSRSFRFVSGELGLPFQLGITINPENDSLIVAKPGKHIRVRSVTTIEGYVTWGETLTVIEAQQAIQKINERTAHIGFYDPVTKMRLSPYRR